MKKEEIAHIRRLIKSWKSWLSKEQFKEISKDIETYIRLEK